MSKAIHQTSAQSTLNYDAPTVQLRQPNARVLKMQYHQALSIRYRYILLQSMLDQQRNS
ncbi:hypothetical protein K7432_011448 [Basidiobolus ranarum]|uniref:Uncharacterized protein n=1 Tax=Basidiobolus ranarum TaxID=34480 RepID=A0ABR2VTU3_9FUNG